MASVHYLLADARTGQIVRRTRNLPKTSQSLGRVVLPVRKAIWKSYRAGHQVQIQDLAATDLAKWLAAPRRHGLTLYR